MTEAERRAFNAGLEVAGEMIVQTAAATRRDVKVTAVAETVAGVLDGVADGLALLVQPERETPEARRRAFALVQA